MSCLAPVRILFCLLQSSRGVGHILLVRETLAMSSTLDDAKPPDVGVCWYMSEDRSGEENPPSLLPSLLLVADHYHWGHGTSINHTRNVWSV